ncbi:MAG TPA: hypothetical protein VFB62_24765 [Polyangiaceae bacterium]|jgi:hypothetical protein|nr:hypothetical protein [Polyangiaceae bacterium]
MRTLLGLPIFIAMMSACVADVEDEAQRDESATTEQPGDMPSYDDGDDPRDPCSIGLAFDDTGELLSVPTECIAEPEVDDGDPAPDAEGVSEPSVLPH